jgi:hypothetical protein
VCGVVNIHRVEICCIGSRGTTGELVSVSQVIFTSIIVFIEKIGPHPTSGPYLIIARVGSLAYRLQLPESMAGVHQVFHISMLRKYIRDPELKIEVDPIIIQQDLTIDA